MEDDEDMQAMFGCFQTILNELRCLNKIFDNYDNIENFLKSLSKKVDTRGDWNLKGSRARTLTR